MAIQIQFRRDTSTNWTNTNPTLAQGELGLETDTQKFKIGNGSDDWNTLPYSSEGSSLWESDGLNTIKPIDSKKVKTSHLQSLKFDFEISDWIISDNNYILETEHNLGDKKNFKILEDKQPILLESQVENNKIILIVPADPDLRFEGTLII